MKSPVRPRTAASQINGPAYYRRLLANRPHPLENLDALAVMIAHRRGEEICSQGRPVEYWYLIISGAARRCAIRPDGRRQIVDLLLPGDFCGFAIGEEWDATVEAVTDGTVAAAYPRRRIEALADCDSKIAREMRQIAFAALSRLEAQLLILGRITALEKVGSFILEMAARLSHGNADHVALPVSRYDIADYLGVSVETVSRSLSDLKHRGAINLHGTRSVSIVDRDVLEEGERHEHRCHQPKGHEHRSQQHRSDEHSCHA
jgi:CRP/FNR family transcriptional regulator, nitrogen fixation regulation protein